LSKPDDVFYLESSELLSADHGDGRKWREVVANRRRQRAAHLAVVIPNAWRGRPEPKPLAVADPRFAGARIQAIGASPGVVEGRVRVVTDPTEAELDEGDVLVAVTTDPGWASLMFVSSALVVDLGGLLSHAAVVARELGIPCVMGTESGTTRLRTGDHVRVDGGSGTVELLRLADGADASNAT